MFRVDQTSAGSVEKNRNETSETKKKNQNKTITERPRSNVSIPFFRKNSDHSVCTIDDRTPTVGTESAATAPAKARASTAEDMVAEVEVVSIANTCRNVFYRGQG